LKPLVSGATSATVGADGAAPPELRRTTGAEPAPLLPRAPVTGADDGATAALGPGQALGRDEVALDGAARDGAELDGAAEAVVVLPSGATR
jgi:hypothetical protein